MMLLYFSLTEVFACNHVGWRLSATLGHLLFSTMRLFVDDKIIIKLSLVFIYIKASKKKKIIPPKIKQTNKF